MQIKQGGGRRKKSKEVGLRIKLRSEYSRDPRAL
jgi:hypothetical protein